MLRGEMSGMSIPNTFHGIDDMIDGFINRFHKKYSLNKGCIPATRDHINCRIFKTNGILLAY